MATTYKSLAQAQAAYDDVEKQKQRIQRNDYIAEQQAVMGVNNYLKQHGYNGGAAESILLRARGNRSDISNYDSQLAALAAIISGFRQASSGGGGTIQGTPLATPYAANTSAQKKTAPTYTQVSSPSNISSSTRLQQKLIGRKY